LVDAADGQLTDGFHGYEPEAGLRWTNGDAVLPLALFDDLSAPVDIELHLTGTTAYPVLADYPVLDAM
jgi:hypothetical protein